MFKFDNLSEPYWRDIFTSKPRPRLASQAPNVSRSKLIVGILNLLIRLDEGINITKVNIIPSKHRSSIRKCFWFDKNVNKNEQKEMIDNINKYSIELRKSSLIYKINALGKLSIQFTLCDCWYPKSIFLLNYKLYNIIILFKREKFMCLYTIYNALG